NIEVIIQEFDQRFSDFENMKGKLFLFKDPSSGISVIFKLIILSNPGLKEGSTFSSYFQRTNFLRFWFAA
ncbi:hypothetical protein L9F63_002252, partial [Diploptera punctata]